MMIFYSFLLALATFAAFYALVWIIETLEFKYNIPVVLIFTALCILAGGTTAWYMILTS